MINVIKHFVEHDVMILLSSNYNVDQVKKYEDKNKKPHYAQRHIGIGVV